MIIMSDTFDSREFKCHDGTPTPLWAIPRLESVHSALVKLKDALISKFGSDVELEIVSAYRSPEHNEFVGGKPHSEHMRGLASDIKVAGIAPEDVAEMVDCLQAAGNLPLGGLGRYDTFTHVDIRGYHARWDERTSKP